MVSSSIPVIDRKGTLGMVMATHTPSCCYFLRICLAPQKIDSYCPELKEGDVKRNLHCKDYIYIFQDSTFSPCNLINLIISPSNTSICSNPSSLVSSAWPPESLSVPVIYSFTSEEQYLLIISSTMATFPAFRLSSCIAPLPLPTASMPLKYNGMRPESAQHRDMVFLTHGSLGSLRGGAGVLERPNLDQSQFDPLAEAEEGGDIGRLSKRKGLGSGDSYKVLLIDDARHTEMLANDARKLFHESRERGVAVVIVTVKEHAEFYAQMMLRNGLRSAIEPNSDKA